MGPHFPAEQADSKQQQQQQQQQQNGNHFCIYMGWAVA